MPQTYAPIGAADWLRHVKSLQQQPGAPDERPWIGAEVRKLNLQAGGMTISHGPLPSIDMPAMTMTFPVKDGAHLRMLKVGDRIEVQAANESGTVKTVNVR